MKKRIIVLGVLIVAVLLLMGGSALAQAPIFPAYYSGTATIAGAPLPDGIDLYAKVADWQSYKTEVAAGKYSLAVSPPSTAYIGKTVEFYIDGVKAAESATFPDTYNPATNRFVTLNLTFPSLPAVGDVSLTLVMMGLAVVGALGLLSGIGLLRKRYARA